MNNDESKFDMSSMLKELEKIDSLYKNQDKKKFLGKKSKRYFEPLPANKEPKEKAYEQYTSFIKAYDKSSYRRGWLLNLNQDEFIKKYNILYKFPEFRNDILRVATNISVDLEVMHIDDKISINTGRCAILQ